MAGYGDTLTGIADIVEKASPWDLLTGLLVTKPAQAEAAQLAAQQLNAQVAEQQLEARSETLKVLMLAGAGLVGVLVLALSLKSKPNKSVAGYRRRRRR